MTALSTPDDAVAGDGVPESLRVVLDAATERLAAAGVDSARHDAEALVAHVLGTLRSGLWRHRELDVDARVALDALVDERARRVPLQHLTGVAGFRRLDLSVGPGVFVPRPETEVLVEWGLAVLAGRAAPLVVDLCAGSAAIALSIAAEHRGARVHAVELEPHAVAWAERNVARLALSVAVHVGDATDPDVLAELDGTADLVLANPPYVPDGMVVPPEVGEHDPPAALWGGPDGMRVVAGVAARAHRLLAPGGWFGVEHADSQPEQVGRLLGATGQWADVSCHRDLAGRPRFTVGRPVRD